MTWSIFESFCFIYASMDFKKSTFSFSLTESSGEAESYNFLNFFDSPS